MDTQKLLSRWLKRLKPDYSILKVVDAFVDEVNSAIGKKKIHAICVPGGSIAKNTFLKDDHDVDLFVRFEMQYADMDISKILDDIIHSMHVKYVRIHGSRDYFQIKHKSLSFEIIPVLLVHPSNYQQARNVTDLSPEHVFWVHKHTDKRPELADEIRLAKQFCKACGVYGAESYINGFSGHILDILIIHFGSFKNLVLYFSRLDVSRISSESPIIIDHEGHLSNPIKQLNKSKITPLIVVDPIQKDRNAAAALSKEKFSTFIKCCKDFLENPTDKAFIVKSLSLEDVLNSKIRELKNLSKRKLTVILLKIKTLDSSKDIMGTKVLKIYEDLVQHCAINGFEVLGSYWVFTFEKKFGQIALIFSSDKLPESIEHQGPPLSAIESCKKFKLAHREDSVFIKNNRLYSIIKRKYTLPKNFLADIITQSFIMSRVQSIKIDKIISK